MPKHPIDEIVVFPRIILSRELLMSVAQVDRGASTVRQSVLETSAVGGLDWASVGGDVVGGDANSLFH